MIIKNDIVTHEFNPTEIIFACTTLCNLHCSHCFVERIPEKLNIEDAKKFILSCKENPKSKIGKIGFSGGEPFLAQEFLCEVINFSRKNDFMFDQIMTNGVWWKDETELFKILEKIYNAGYDGKIGISYDKFHGQNYEKIRTFCKTVNEIFGEESISIQAVMNSFFKDDKKLKDELNSLSKDFSANIFILPQSFSANDERAWKSRKWFKEDFCAGPGNILFVHPTGKITHCCGFANENPNLFIGNINQSFDEILENAEKNKMVNIVYNLGLEKYRKFLKKEKIKFPGKTNDICSFCDFICKNNFDDIFR